MGEVKMFDDDHDTLCREVLEDVIEWRPHPEKGWRAKGIKCSRLTTTQNRWIGKIDEKYHTRKNSSEVVQCHNIVEIPGGLILEGGTR